MRRITMLLVAMGVAASAPAHQAQDRQYKLQPRGCSAIEVTAPGLKKQPRKLQFNTSRVVDLDFETQLDQPVYGDHVLHFKVYTPSGFLYQDLQVPFTWPRPGRAKLTRTVESASLATSFPKGVPVQQLGQPPHRGGRVRDRVNARLPVAGTSITMSTLYGRWMVQAFLDENARPCSPPVRFTIDSK
jgi:hypothetical protein